MRFEFCGNSDCPEWVLSGIVLVNRMSTIKLKIILAQISKKIISQGSGFSGELTYDQDRLFKLCKDQKFEQEETRCFLAIIEFILCQAAKHDTSDITLSKDLTQMGVAIESSNGITKAFAENQDHLVKAMKNQTLRVSALSDLNYKLSYLMASSMTGKAEEDPT